jgi:hypothetical protein
MVKRPTKTSKRINRQTLRSLGRELPSQEEFSDIQSDLIESSDRTAAIIASSLLEVCLEKSILAALPRAKGVIDQLNGRDGALNGFYSKNYLGYAMSLYSDDVLTQLETIRKIRNAFAHTARPIKFTTPVVGKECAKLTFGESSRGEWPETLSKERVAFTAACISLTKVLLAGTVVKKIQSLATKVSGEQIKAILAEWEDEPFYSQLIGLLAIPLRS